MLVNRNEKLTMNTVVRAWAHHRVEAPLLARRVRGTMKQNLV